MKESKSDGTAKSKEASSGWSLFGRGKKKVKVANLGEESSMYYNKELKRWVERGKEAEAAAEAAADAAPPKQIAHVPSAPSGGRKAITQRYVLQNNLSVSSSASSSFADIAGLHSLNAAQASSLVPPSASNDRLATPRQFFVPQPSKAGGQSDANGTDTNAPKFFIPGSNNGNSKRQSGSIYSSYSRSRRSSIEIESRLSDPGSTDKVQDLKPESSVYSAPAAQVPATAGASFSQHEPQESYREHAPEAEVNFTVPQPVSHSKQSQLAAHEQTGKQAEEEAHQSKFGFQFKAGLVDTLKAKMAENIKKQELSKRASFDFDRVMHPGVPHKLDGPLPWELPDHLKHSDQFISICTNWQKNNPGVAYNPELLLASITEIPRLPSAAPSTANITPATSLTVTPRDRVANGVTVTPRDHPAANVMSPTHSQGSVNQPEPTNNRLSSFQRSQQSNQQPTHASLMGVVLSEDGLSGQSSYSLPMPPDSTKAQFVQQGKQQVNHSYDEVAGGMDLSQSDMHDPEAMGTTNHKHVDANSLNMPTIDVEGPVDNSIHDVEGSTIDGLMAHEIPSHDDLGDGHSVQQQQLDEQVVDETMATHVVVQSETTVTLTATEEGIQQQQNSDASVQQPSAAEEQAYWLQWYEYVQQQLQQNPDYINTEEYAQWYNGYNDYLARQAQQQNDGDAAFTVVTTTETTSMLVVEQEQVDNNHVHSHDHHDTTAVRTVVENAMTAVLMAAEPTDQHPIASSDHDADVASLSAELSLRIDSKRHRTSNSNSFDTTPVAQHITQCDSLAFTTVVHQAADAAVADIVSDALDMHQAEASFELQPFLHANGIDHETHTQQGSAAQQQSVYANGITGQFTTQNGLHHDAEHTHASSVQHGVPMNGTDLYGSTSAETDSGSGRTEHAPEQSLTEAAGCIEQLLHNLKAGLPVSPAALQGVSQLMQLLSDPALAALCGSTKQNKPYVHHVHVVDPLSSQDSNDEQPEIVHSISRAGTAKYSQVNGYASHGYSHQMKHHQCEAGLNMEVTAAVQEVHGQYQQRISELEAEVAQHKAAYEETKADLDELMLCLGQETTKVSELCNAVQSMGGDPQQIIGPIEEAYAMQGLTADDNIAVPAEYEHVDDNGSGYHQTHYQALDDTQGQAEQIQQDHSAQNYEDHVQYANMTTDATYEHGYVKQQGYHQVEDGGFGNMPTLSQQPQVQGYSNGSARASFESVSRSPMLCV